MSRQSAGLLLYRIADGSPEVFLAHPGGPYWAKKDDGAWSIPKGELAEGEDPLEAARREFTEETSVSVNGGFAPLRPIRQSGGKLVYAWAVEGDLDAAAIRSNTFAMEWPPRSGRTGIFPEIDRAAWFDLTLAKRKIVKGQVALLEELEQMLCRPGR